MKNFGRAVRVALRFRWTLIGLLLSSVLVACFWGANFGLVYPILGVVLKQQSMHEWVDASISTSRDRCSELSTEIAAAEIAAAERAGDAVGDRRHHELQQSRLQAEQQALASALRLQPWIHRYMPDRPFPTLVFVVCGLMLGTLLKTVFLVANVIMVERLTQLVTLELRNSMYRRALSLDLAHFGEDRTSALVSRFTHDMDGITSGIGTMFGRAIREPLKVIACLAGAAFVCWRLLIFCLITTPVAIYLINRLARSVKRANRRAMDQMAGVYNQLTESFNGIHTVKAYTMERHERRRMHLRCKDYYHKAMRIAVYHAAAKPCTEVMSIGVVCLAILAGGYLVLNQATDILGLKMCDRPLTFEALMTFFVLLGGVSDPFRKLAEVYNQIQRGAAAADRVYELIDRRPSVRTASLSNDSLPPLHSLTFHDVDFAYRPDQPVLASIDLTIPAGKRIAIIGPNGCGKSTLAKLIPRFYDPAGGCIRWNDQDLRNLRLRSLRQRIGIVSQQASLFDDTVANNIRYGNPFATEFQIVAAAKKAHADLFIRTRLSQGYDTVVGQGGKLLSGGQRQRLSLARAILRDPEILILDEATSQIDVESERLIHQTLEEFTAGRTTIMITHRASTLVLADLIVVMEAGRIVDVGSHAELLERCEFYQRLHEHQFQVSA